MKKLLVCLSLAAALTLPVVAGEKSEKAGDKPCCKEKAGCPEKAKAACKEKSGCKEAAAKKSAAANVKGAQVLKQ
jgi:hypothetical protein